jgi:hypothetical protein
MLSLLFSGFGFHENRRHPRAKIKWPVVMTSDSGLVDARTQNVSLGGAFIRCGQQANLEHNFRLVMTTKDRLILVNAEVVWTYGHGPVGRSNQRGMGVRFTKISGNDRSFLNTVIANHL